MYKRVDGNHHHKINAEQLQEFRTNKDIGLVDDAFFFQAEDGIRDTSVTGVQTCALPICAVLLEQLRPGGRRGCRAFQERRRRSEERRVGREREWRWSGGVWRNIGE